MEALHEETFSRSGATVYALEGDSVDWFTGYSNGGEQLLIVLQFPNIVVIHFTKHGYLTRMESVPGFPTQSSGFFRQEDDDAFNRWLNGIEFVPALITVRKFSLPDYGVRISDFPDYFQAILLNPTQHSLQDQQLAQNEVVRWSSEGIFELSLNQHTDIWIDASGRIIAT